MNGGVRKTQNIYYSKVQFALLSLVLKKQEERERKDLNTNTREQAQVRLDFRWQKGLLEAECNYWKQNGGSNLSPRERSGNRVPSRNLGTSPGSCHPEAQSETWDWQHLHVRHFFSFQFQLKKTNNNKKPNKQHQNNKMFKIQWLSSRSLEQLNAILN